MRYIAALICLFMVSSVFGGFLPATESEIAHLVGFVENSSCKVIRNGSAYEGTAAAEHIRKKYEYFKDKIDSTEKFIEYSATKSTMSGKYYQVKCGEKKPVKMHQWLLQELKKYRETENT